MRKITSPIPAFPGSVEIPDTLSFAEYFAWKKAVENAAEKSDYMEKVFDFLPGILAVVKKWEIKGIENPSLDNFPATPVAAVIGLIGWLIGEIGNLVNGVDEAPNE